MAASALDRAHARGIDPAAVAFDIDGVFADTMRLFVRIVREDFRHAGLRYEDITSYALDECLDLTPEVLSGAIARILDGTHRQALQPMEGAPEVVCRMSRACGPVLFVTARPDKDFIEPWIAGVLPPGHNGVQVVATGDFDAKLEVLVAHGKQVFVEDRLETCFALARDGITPIVYRQPWNRRAHPFIEVGSWIELAGLMRLS
jgi:hypothetical protein